MYIEQGLLTELLVDTNITAHTGTRIYYVTAPQTVATPYITFFRVSTNPVMSHDGGSHLERSRFQFDIWSLTYYEAKQIAEHLITKLQGLNELIGTGDAVRVCGILYRDQNDFYENDTKLHHIAIDMEVPYET